MSLELEANILEQLLGINAELAALNQIVPFLLAGSLRAADNPEAVLKVLADSLDARISKAEAGRSGMPGEPVRAAPRQAHRLDAPSLGNTETI